MNAELRKRGRAGTQTNIAKDAFAKGATDDASAQRECAVQEDAPGNAAPEKDARDGTESEEDRWMSI